MESDVQQAQIYPPCTSNPKTQIHPPTSNPKTLEIEKTLATQPTQQSQPQQQTLQRPGQILLFLWVVFPEITLWVSKLLPSIWNLGFKLILRSGIQSGSCCCWKWVFDKLRTLCTHRVLVWAPLFLTYRLGILGPHLGVYLLRNDTSLGGDVLCRL